MVDNDVRLDVNPLIAKITKWSNTLKQSLLLLFECV